MFPNTPLTTFSTAISTRFNVPRQTLMSATLTVVDLEWRGAPKL
jgi:hypothetical protein